MLKLTLKRGDAIHVVLPDGSDGLIEARNRCELWVRLPDGVKVRRKKGPLTPENLIKPNQN